MKAFPFMYKAGKAGRPGSVTVLIDGNPEVLDGSSPNYNSLCEALKNGAWSKVRDLMSVKKAIAMFSNGRVQILGSELLVDGVPLHNALSKRVMEMYRAGFDLKPLTNFLNNMQDNPSPEARDELYLFLDACNLPITEDGHFLAYKYVNKEYKDCHTGKFDNSVGARPKMNREDCDTDRNRTCSTGLHFCAREYLGQTLTNDSYRIMMVKVNPRDVTAIPSDYNNSKGRACEYEVVEEIGQLEITPNYRSTDGSVPEAPILDSKSLQPTAADRKINNAAKVTGVKLTPEKVLDIRKMLAEGFKYPVIALKHGIHRRSVERIDKGEAWSHVKSDKIPPRKLVKPVKRNR